MSQIRPARAGLPRHGSPLGAAVDGAGATQDRPSGEDPHSGVGVGPGATREGFGSEAGTLAWPGYLPVGWAEFLITWVKRRPLVGRWVGLAPSGLTPEEGPAAEDSGAKRELGSLLR